MMIVTIRVAIEDVLSVGCSGTIQLEMENASENNDCDLSPKSL